MNDSATPTSEARTPAAAPNAARPKSARRRARELALQGLYEWQISRGEVGVILSHMGEQDGHGQSDQGHLTRLLEGCIRDAVELDGHLQPHLDRRIQDLSPIEHAVLLIGVYELKHCVDVPYRVAINEAVELAKSFGGTDGHKYVNGVLDRCAADLRPDEVASVRTQRRR